MSKPGAYLKLDGNGEWWCDPQDYSGFGLKPQTRTPKSAQLASRAPARAAGKSCCPGRERGDLSHLPARRNNHWP